MVLTTLFDDLISVLKVGYKDYAIIIPNEIVLVVDVSGTELRQLMDEIKLSHKNEPSTAFVSDESEERASLTLLPTFDCNLRCIYCYARGGDDKQYMSLEMAKSSLDALRSSSSADFLDLSFAGGGEPFLNFEVMKYALQYARTLFKEVQVNLVTNGTFNSEQLEWLISNNISIRISCDGIAHQLQRPFADGTSSLELVERNILNLVQSDIEFMVQTIVTSDSIKQIVETVDYFAQIGVTTLKVEPVHISETSRGKADLEPSPLKFVSGFVSMVKRIVDKGYPIKVDTSYLSRPTTGYYCGVHGENTIVTPNGDITACVEITRPSEPFADVLIYGQVNDSRFKIAEETKLTLSNLHFENYEHCPTCPLRLICKGGCPMKNIWDTGFLPSRSRYTCQIERLLVPRIFGLIIEDARFADVVFDNHSVQVC